MSAQREPPPLRTDDKRTVAVGTALWVVLLIGLVVRRDALQRADLMWWFWMGGCGVVLGLLGLVYLRVRPAQLARRQQQPRDETSAAQHP